MGTSSDDRADGIARGGDAYRELFERSADAILIIEGEKFVDCNAATVKMLRLPDRAAVLRTHPSELSPEFQPDGQSSFDKANEMIRIAFQEGSHRFEWDHRRADGEVFPVEVLLTAVEAGDRPTLHVVWRDISDRKRLQADLRQAQKMEAIGNLAGGIAHDFNNSLVAIMGNAELLEMALRREGTPWQLARISEIRHAGERAAELTQQLLAYSRKQVLQLRPVDFTAIVAELEGMVRRLIGEDIHFDMDLPREPVVVKADAGQLRQVVLNLLTNARDATPAGGSVRLRLDTVRAEDVEPKAATHEPAGVFARLEVTDTGMGIDEAVLPQIFDPFFTTKPRGEGTGLGLSTVHGIVRQSGGDVAVFTSPTAGTRFRVLLGLTDEQPLVGEEAPRRPVVVRSAQERILVVEDEDPVANVIIEILRSAGYHTARARDGADGLQQLRTSHEPYNLVLSDVIMPVLGGPEMMRQLGRPDQKVLFVSGYTERALTDRGSLSPDVDLLRKPFSVNDLLARVREVLDR